MIGPDAPLQSVSNARAGGNITQNLIVSGGSTLGSGIWTWGDWRKRALGGGAGSGAASTRFLEKGHRIQRRIESRLLIAARKALEADEAGTVTVSLVGKHGAGRSVAVMWVARELADSGRFPVFVVDDYLRFSQTDLTTILPRGQRCVVVIDDADVQQAARPVFNSSGGASGLDVCFLATFSLARQARAFRGLGGATSELLEMSDRPSDSELSELADRLGAGTPSQNVRKSLARCNIRAAHRLLVGDAAPAEVAESIAQLRDDPETSKAAAALILAGALDVLLPAPLVNRLHGSPLPAKLEPWMQSRPVFEGANESRSVWIEDPELLRLADTLWNADHGIDEQSSQELSQDLLAQLFIAVDPTRAGERLATRQLLRRANPDLSRPAASRASRVLTDCVQQEDDRAALLSWGTANPRNWAGEPALRDELRARLRELDPDMGALVGFVIDESESRVRRPIDLGPVATLDQCAALLEMSEGANGGVLGVRVLPIIVDLIQNQEDPHRILSIRNSSQILGYQLARQGRPTDRIWLRSVFLATSNLAPHQALPLFDLAGRTMRQERHGLAMDRVWNPPRADERMVRSLRREYERLYQLQDAPAEQVVRWATQSLAKGGGKPGTMDQFWGQSLEFAALWVPEQLPELADCAYNHVIERLPEVGLRNVQHALHKLLRLGARRQFSGENKLRELLHLLDNHGFDRTVPWQTLFPMFAALLAGSNPEVGDAALNCLRSHLIEYDDARRAHFEESLDRLLHALELGPSGALLTLDGRDIGRGYYGTHAADTVIAAFRYFPEESKREDAKALIRQFGAYHRTKNRLFTALIDADFLDLAKALIPSNWKDDDWRIRNATLLAAQGNLERAREIVLARNGPPVGAFVVSIAQRHLALATRGYERQMWDGLSKLNQPTRLPPWRKQ